MTFSRAKLPQSTILAGITPSSTNNLTRLDVDTQGAAKDYGAGLRLNYDLPGGTTLTSISSYDKYKLTDFKDSDSSDFDFQTLTVGGVNFAAAPAGGVGDGGTFDVKTVTQELRVTSPAADRFRYVPGPCRWPIAWPRASRCRPRPATPTRSASRARSPIVT